MVAAMGCIEEEYNIKDPEEYKWHWRQHIQGIIEDSPVSDNSLHSNCYLASFAQCGKYGCPKHCQQMYHIKTWSRFPFKRGDNNQETDADQGLPWKSQKSVPKWSENTYKSYSDQNKPQQQQQTSVRRQMKSLFKSLGKYTGKNFLW